MKGSGLRAQGEGLMAKGLALAAGLTVSSLVVSSLIVFSLVVSGFPPPLRAVAAELRRDHADAPGAKAGSRTSPPQQPAPQIPPPTFRTEANYVRVDAYPTKDDVPVADLTQADFEILENGQPQKIEQFERVVVRGGIPQDLRREPNSVEEGRQAAQNPRARVVVLFLDINHVSVDGSARIRKPLDICMISAMRIFARGSPLPCHSGIGAGCHRS